MEYYQQGDILIKPFKPKKNTLKKKHLKKNNIIAWGEATGHSHRVIGDHEIYDTGHFMYLNAKTEVEVRHEEHKPIKIPPGVYQLDGVREFNHFDREIRRVVD